MKSPPKNAKAGQSPGHRSHSAHDLTARRVGAASLQGNRELSYREICEIMGRTLRVLPSSGEQEKLELGDGSCFKETALARWWHRERKRKGAK